MLPNGQRPTYVKFMRRFIRKILAALRLLLPSLSSAQLIASHWRDTSFTGRAGRAFGGGESWAMSPTILRPLARKLRGEKPPRRERRDRSSTLGRRTLIDRRDHCMAAIARCWSEPGDQGQPVRESAAIADADIGPCRRGERARTSCARRSGSSASARGVSNPTPRWPWLARIDRQTNGHGWHTLR